MFHHNRTWQIAEVSTPEELAEKLVDHTWCCCQGFYVKGRPDILFLNDSTSPDGAQEFAVVSRRPDGSMVQIESITFGWCSLEDGLKHVRAMLADSPEVFYGPVKADIEDSQSHRCYHCA